MAYYKAQKMKINGRYYPVAVITDRPMETDELAQQISEASTVSKADVVAVLAALPSVMTRGMDAGRSVHLQDVGYFRYTAAAKKGGQETAEKVTASDIDYARVQFRPETQFKNGATTRVLSNNVHWTRWEGKEAEGTSEGEGEGEGGGELPLG